MADIIKTFINEEDGVATEVVKREDGKLLVRIRDTDADAYLPMHRLYEPGDEKAALHYAKSVADGVSPDGEPVLVEVW